MKRAAAILALAIAACGSFHSGSAAASCQPILDADAALAAEGGMRLDALMAANDAAEAAGCSADERQQIARWLALGMLYKASQESADYAEAEPILDQALAIATPWQVLAAAGDAARARRDFARAAERYQLALQDVILLSDPASAYWDLPPDEATVRDLRRKTDEMRLVSSSFVSIPGRPACQIQSLGMWAAEIVAPIRFVTDEVSFTEAGAEAADELYACLSSLDPAEIVSVTVIGHTDERGEAEYNRDLSNRRAQAVKAHLESRGLQIPLKVEGRGESELFQPDSAVAYTQEELWQMSRRVEVDVVRTGD